LSVPETYYTLLFTGKCHFEQKGKKKKIRYETMGVVGWERRSYTFF